MPLSFLDPSLFSRLANALRFLAIDSVEQAQSGHPGMPMGMADVATVLFTRHLRFSADHPDWANRDRFVLSAGHGSMLLYGLLYLTGYKGWELSTLQKFRQWGSMAAGHPEVNQALGIETTTGPLGQGLATAVGIALGGAFLKARHAKDVYHFKTYCIVGDGCLMEGLSQEAISFAGHYGLRDLIVLFDDNHISIDGPTSLSTSENYLERFKACGWSVQAIDGHDILAIDKAITQAKGATVPTLIACRTKIGFGSPLKAGTAKAHGSPLGKAEVAATRQALGWPYPPFQIPDDLLRMWREAGTLYHQEAALWIHTHKGSHPSLDEGMVKEALKAQGADFLHEPKPMATRQASAKVIEKLMAQDTRNLIGGSADLTASNLTKASCASPITAHDFSGTYIHYGIREHAMAAIMNGLALTGFRPFGGTFLAFSDYLRPALRLSALMHLPVIYVLTHDSIGLGEDGPTHQPIEHLAALRAMPQLDVYRPADAIETLECWELALIETERPSVLALSRQDLPLIRQDASDNKCRHGGYVIHGDPYDSALTLLATGSEVAIAIDTAKLLERQDLKAHVVSLPCIEKFLKMPAIYQEKCIPPHLPKAAIEAAASLGWDRLLKGKGLFFGLDYFGASAPCDTLYKSFGLDAESIAHRLMQLKREGEKNG